MKSANDAFRDDLTPESLASLQEIYDIGPWTDYRRTEKGSANTSFFVTSPSGQYVFRRSNDRKTLESMEFEVALIDYLCDHFYPAPRILRTAAGESYTMIDGTFYFATLRIKGGAYDPQNGDHLVHAAEGLARYHQLVATFPRPAPASSTLVLPDLGERGARALGEFARLAKELLSPEAYATLRGSFDASARHAQRLGEQVSAINDLPETIIQGSYGRSALLFDGDHLAGVVDYDRAGWDLRAIDLAYSVKALCRSALGTGWIGLDSRLVTSFLAAYQAVLPLPRHEVEALPLVFQVQRLSKLIRKCENLARKNEVAAQQIKDVEKVSAVVVREIDRIHWLDGNSTRLVAELVS